VHDTQPWVLEFHDEHISLYERLVDAWKAACGESSSSHTPVRRDDHDIQQ